MLGHISCFALYLIQSIQKHNTGIRTFQSLRGGYILLDYIWLDDKSPILEQLPRNFKSDYIATSFYPNAFRMGKVCEKKTI